MGLAWGGSAWWPRSGPGVAARLVGCVLGALAVVVPAGTAFAEADALPVRMEPPASLSGLITSVSPAVVDIATGSGLAAFYDPEDLPVDPQGFIDDFLAGIQRAPYPQIVGQGSGFVIDPTGYIVTNNHVIADAEEVLVTLWDGTRLIAQIIGKDAATDLALLKVDPVTPLTAVPWGDSDALAIGDWVMTIGNPFGFGGSAAIGIISGRNRNVFAGPYEDFLQTDAAINSGNSGGPLFNMAGEVVGVNSAMSLSEFGGSVGIGFAIPANDAVMIVDQLRAFGEPRRGWLGVRIQDVTPEMTERMGLPRVAGGFVAEVQTGSPAEAAGIVVGDVIVAIGGQEVRTMRDVPRLIAGTAPDATVDLDLIRRTEPLTLPVTVGLLEEAEAGLLPLRGEGQAPEQRGPEAPAPTLGLTFAPIDSATRERLDLAPDFAGVLIVAVDPDSQAAARGVMPGQVITQISQRPVATPDDAAARIAELHEEGRLTALLRFVDPAGGEASYFVTLRL